MILGRRKVSQTWGVLEQKWSISSHGMCTPVSSFFGREGNILSQETPGKGCRVFRRTTAADGERARAFNKAQSCCPAGLQSPGGTAFPCPPFYHLFLIVPVARVGFLIWESIARRGFTA